MGTGARVVDNMERMAGGPYPGYRRSSARGACYAGTFTPTGAAERLTRAAHLRGESVAVTVRFSNSEGNPSTPDGMPVTRGMATRFHLEDGSDTDLLGITVPRFVASTPEEFLELTEALRPDEETGARVQAFVAAHPHLAEAITQRPPVPASYGTAAYWAIHAFNWVNDAGTKTAVKYRWEPEAGRAELSDEEAAGKAGDYLTAELDYRLLQGPVGFTMWVQLGEDEDPTDDPTVVWPEGRPEIAAGRLELTGPVEEQEQWSSRAFSPTLVTDGIELSDDPVLNFRAEAYAESYRRRSAER